ncbi:MAG: DNA polymerase II [Ignavibacteriaceae bacterium]|nr:DNA polymerase II [Ignavibacteriaceae bacterium]
MKTSELFILTSEWRDHNGRNVIVFHGISNENGPVQIVIDQIKNVFFVGRDAQLPPLNLRFERKQVQLKSFSGREVDALYFYTNYDLRKAAELLQQSGITTYEADVDPIKRFLMERGINAQMKVTGESVQKKNLTVYHNPKVEACQINPRFKVLSLDIETGTKQSQLYSIALHLTFDSQESKKVFLLSHESKNLPEYVEICSSESDLIQKFVEWFKQADPDIIIGWHVVGFDLMYLESKANELGINFTLGRDDSAILLRSRKAGSYFAFIPGRIVIDGPTALRNSFYSFEDFRLETVAQELLGRGKLITSDDRPAEIDKYFEEDKAKLCEYNLNDAMLVSEIFAKTGLIDLLVKRSQISGLLLDQLGMMSAAFDHFYLPKIHRAELVAPNVNDVILSEHAAGGHVIDPIPGIYHDVIVLDFKSLYPSIIQSFKIDPVSRLFSHIDTITTPEGYKFSASKHFLPGFINELMKKRIEASKVGDKHLSQAIKILMNSFYGVMGSNGCRFYHPHLPSAITGTGKWLLLQSKDYLHKQGYEVIYGDTDSLFVKLKPGEGETAKENGERIAAELNEYWKKRLKEEFGVTSFLELEFEKYYSRFVLTPLRSGEQGAKKRYAGLLKVNGEDELEFVGMEFVRSDWTKLAKEFQVQLYMKVFNDEDVTDWIRNIVNKVNRGAFDDKLVYRKRLRKELDEYQKSSPPHVRAARMINKTSGTVEYVITKRGPVPIELKHGDLDYQHYIDKQLKPIADSVLGLFGESFDSIYKSPQLDFFD